MLKCSSAAKRLRPPKYWLPRISRGQPQHQWPEAPRKIQLDRGAIDAAVADVRQALNDQPRSAELMLLLAVAYERGGKIERAEKQFADATKASNFDPTIGLNYVELFNVEAIAAGLKMS